MNDAQDCLGWKASSFWKGSGYVDEYAQLHGVGKCSDKTYGMGAGAARRNAVATEPSIPRALGTHSLTGADLLPSLSHTRSIVHDWKILVSPTHSPRSLWQDEGSPKETKLLPPQPAQHSADPPFKYPRPNTKNRRLFVQKDLSVSLKTSSWNNRFSGPAVCGMDRGSFTKQLCRLSVAKFTVATAMRAETAPQAILKGAEDIIPTE